MWPLGKPDRVDQLNQHAVAIACEGEASINRRARDVDFRRQPSSPRQRSETIVLARGAYLEYRSEGSEQPLAVRDAELRNAQAIPSRPRKDHLDLGCVGRLFAGF